MAQKQLSSRSQRTIASPVLIVSTVVDVATDAVIGELSRRDIPFLRINTEDYPFAGELSYRPGVPGRQLFSERALSIDIRSIWYRRFRVPARPESMDPGIYDFCVRESRNALLGGVLGRSCRWMSRPDAIWRAEFKPYQLEVAATIGLTFPKTLISNIPNAVRSFFGECEGQMIAKPVRSGHIVQEGVDHAVYTTRIAPEDLHELQDASLSPTIYQELVPKRFDLRVTVVGRKVFAAAIESQTDPDAAIDWRRTSDPKLPHHAFCLPSDIERQLLAFMDALNLQYGAIDLVLTPDGRYVFLEVNPNGQWLWLDDMLSLGISSEIAEWLGRESG